MTSIPEPNPDAEPFCIAIASHISNINRIPYLQECLRSLVSQTVPITIYLSISFATPDIRDRSLTILYADVTSSFNEYLNIRVRDQKTPQMRHFFRLYPEIVKKHKWVMFCDDDDTYNLTRVERIVQTIRAAQTAVDNSNESSQPTNHLAGLYENVSNITHRSQRHEYWCYCVHIGILGRFFDVVEPVPGILDDRCCDVLFAEYLRRKSSTGLYATLPQTLYHYRVDENADSVTGFIQTNQHKYTNQTSPPPMGDDTWIDYVLQWNEYLHDHIHIFLHDTYLRTLIGCDLDAVLRTEFKNNYAILDYVDQKHVRRITDLHYRVKAVCNDLYEIGL